MQIFRPRSARCSETCGSSAPRSPCSSAPGAAAATSTWLAPPTLASPLFSVRFWSPITASPRALRLSTGPPPPLGLVSLGAPISFVFRKVGNQSAWFTVVASNFLPVSLDKVDTIYQKHMGHMLLKVPMDEERMAGFPPLVA